MLQIYLGVERSNRDRRKPHGFQRIHCEPQCVNDEACHACSLVPAARHMRRTSGTEPVAAGMEAGFPFRADDLRDGWLDKSAYHGGDARWLLPYVCC